MPVETPVGMLNEFLVPFVGRIDGQEESFGVSGVNEDRDLEAAAFFPHRIKAGIIDGDELAGLVANTEAEVFEEFQSTGPTRNGIAEEGDHLFAEVRVVDLAVVELGEDH